MKPAPAAAAKAAASQTPPPASKKAAGPGVDENVSQALTRVFKTKKGPEAASAGAQVIGEFFDKELSSPAKAKPAQPAGKVAGAPPAPAVKAIPVASGAEPTAPPPAPRPLAVLPAEKAPAPSPASKPVASLPSAKAHARPASAPVDKVAPPPAGRVRALSFGGIQAVCARRVNAQKAPLDTPARFGSGDKKIYLSLKSVDPALKDLVRVRWLAQKVEGMPPGRKLAGSRTVLRVGSWNTAVFMPPYGGFWPGRYRVEVRKNEKLLAGLEFDIESPHQSALLLKEAKIKNGFNLALAALGGRVLSATSQANRSSWAKEGLIDGFGYGGENCAPSCGWASSGRKFPQELVFAFNQGRAAKLQGMIMDCESCPGDENCLMSLPRLVEAWVSQQSPQDGYKLVAARRLRPMAVRQFIPLHGVRAKYLKLVIRSNYGGVRRTQLAEVEILEEPGPDSIVTDLPMDLALPALGGSLLRYSSQRYGGEAVRLLSKTADGKGWRSADQALPQEFIFCLRNVGEALIDRLELDLASGHDASTRPKQVAVLLSFTGPLSGFVEAARLEIPANADTFNIPLKRKARFVKLRILENQGGKFTSLGKVAIIEGKAPGYTSLLARPPKPLASFEGKALVQEEPPVTSRVRPGLSPGKAPLLELGARLKAVFQDYSQRHYYSLDLQGEEPGMLNLELTGLPFLRTGFVLKDAADKQVATFDPLRNSSPTTMLSWRLEPGRYLLEARTTPANIVLAWDVSGSMAGHTGLLQKAVTGFLEKVQPSEKLSLIAFNNNLHLLTKGFTSDRQQLLAAVSGKFKAEMATRLYDAAEKGVRLLRDAQGAGAMVVMTDGMDMGSVLKAPGFWDLLQGNPVRIFTIGLGGELKVWNPKAGFSGSLLLSQVARASGGRFIFIPDVSRLVDVYRQVARELLSGTAYYLKPTWTFKQGVLLVKTEGERMAGLAAPPRIELVLDGSGSMKKKLGGKTRMAIAKEVLAELIRGLPPEVEVALRVYGHRIREGRKGACQDTELVYPFGKLDKARLIKKIRAIRPLGTTPIAYSLKQTAKDFGRAKGEKTVILVTDGMEECGGDLVKTVEELRAQGLDVRLHVVGFAVKDPKTHKQMQNAARAGKGSYISAADRSGLKKAMAQALAIPYTVRDSSGREIARGVAGRELGLPAGYYQVSLDTPKGELLNRDVRIRQEQSTVIRVTKDGPKIGVQVLPPEKKP